MQDIEFYYDFQSPNVYLVDQVLPDLAQKHGARIVYRPMLLGGVFKASNNQPPLMAFSGVPSKIEYMRAQMARFIKRYRVAFQMNSHFPVRTVTAMRAGVFAKDKEWERAFIEALHKATWVDDVDIGDAEAMEAVLTAAGLPAGEIMQAAQSDAAKAGLIEATNAAVERKVFGAPTMFVGDEMFFGKDALDELDWVLGQGG